MSKRDKEERHCRTCTCFAWDGLQSFETRERVEINEKLDEHRKGLHSRRFSEACLECRDDAMFGN